ncbi:MAG: hypothetical protein K0U74_09880 [Alphaproteobacteria bacterium]|nr:hypothetical protein [Alphaproteobacteria bacterium]
MRDKSDEEGVPHNPLASLTLSDVVAFVRRRLRILIGVPAVAVLLGIYYVLTATPQYTAVAQVAMERAPSDIARFDTTGAFDTSQVATQMTLLSSTLIARSVAERLEKSKSKAAAPSTKKRAGPSLIVQFKEWLQGLFHAKATLDEAISPEEARLRAFANELQSEVDIDRVGYSYVLKISYTSEDRAAATVRANEYAKAYIADKLQRRERLAQQGADWLEKKLDDVRIQMNLATREVQRFKARGDYSLPSDLFEKKKDDARAPKTGEPATASLEELESRARTYRQIFEGYLKTYTETLQKQSFPFTNARVISFATGPAPKTHPNSKLYVLAAGVIGSVIALGIALLLEGLKGTFFRSARPD